MRWNQSHLLVSRAILPLPVPPQHCHSPPAPLCCSLSPLPLHCGVSLWGEVALPLPALQGEMSPLVVTVRRMGAGCGSQPCTGSLCISCCCRKPQLRVPKATLCPLAGTVPSFPPAQLQHLGAGSQAGAGAQAGAGHITHAVIYTSCPEEWLQQKKSTDGNCCCHFCFLFMRQDWVTQMSAVAPPAPHLPCLRYGENEGT